METTTEQIETPKLGMVVITLFDIKKNKYE